MTLSKKISSLNQHSLETKIRRQLTLFVHKKDAPEIEHVRKQFNPIQQELIDSHVTLCREDEIEDLNAVLNNLQQLNSAKITIHFAAVTRFENGLGVLLPALGKNDGYHLLRSKVLVHLPGTIRKPEPHITLMHPRNSTCTDEIFREIEKLNFPASLAFDTISLIEQEDGKPWQTLVTYKLNDA